MAIEKSGALSYKDRSGKLYTLYPKTLGQNVNLSAEALTALGLSAGSDLEAALRKVYTNVQQSQPQQLTVSLPAAKWTAVGSGGQQYEQAITDSAVTAKVTAGKTMLDCFATDAIWILLRDQGVQRLAVENRDGKPVATLIGDKPTADLSIQLRIQ